MGENQGTCEYCMTADAMPGYKRCEPCLMKEVSAEVRFLYEYIKDLDESMDFFRALIMGGTAAKGK